jgi:hypothetical protein
MDGLVDIRLLKRMTAGNFNWFLHAMFFSIQKGLLKDRWNSRRRKMRLIRMTVTVMMRLKIDSDGQLFYIFSVHKYKIMDSINVNLM